MVTISRTEYEEYLELKKQNERLLEQLCVIRNKQFGSSSEKASEGVYEQMSLLFDEAEVYVSEAEEPSAVEVRSHAKKQKSGQVRDNRPQAEAPPPPDALFSVPRRSTQRIFAPGQRACRSTHIQWRL